MSNPSNRQMNIPVPTRHELQIQTDVNLIGTSISHDSNLRRANMNSSLFDFASRNRLSSFSDYYILSQLEGLVTSLKDNASGLDQQKSQALLFELSSQIHGLLAKQIRLTGTKSSYYELLNDKQKQIIRLQVKYGHYESKIGKYEERISNLERQIENLRGSLKIYQGAAEENEVYKECFKDIQAILNGKKRGEDLEALMKNEVIPKIQEFEINLSDLSKSYSRDRNKLKGAISRFSLQLHHLLKDANLNGEKLETSVSSFYSSLEHLNSDNWVQRRINLAEEHEELMNRHTAVLSLVKKNIDELLKDKSLQSLSEVKSLIEMLQRERMETVIVNGWIGLGVVHCHNHTKSISEEETVRTQQLALLFQREIKSLGEKYPQLLGELSSEMKGLLEMNIVGELVEGKSLGWLKELLVYQTNVVTVDNVYKYYNKNDQQVIFHLRILIKALLEEFERISKTSETPLQLDEGILEMLRAQILEGVNVEDVLALFRSTPRVCEVDVVVDRPYYLNGTKTVSVPIKEETGIALNSLKHVPVALNNPKILYGQEPVQLMEQVLIREKETCEQAFGTAVIDERVVGRILEDQKIIEIEVEKHLPVETVIEKIKEVQQEVMAENQVEVVQEKPYEVIKKVIEQVEVTKEVPKYLYRDITKIVEVPEYIPVIQEKPIYEVVEKKIPYVLKKPEVHYLTKKEIIFDSKEVPKITEQIREKAITIKEHCDCQKPEPVEFKVEKEIIKEIEKEIIVEKCHYVKGDEVEHMIEVECIVQQPIIHEVVVPVERVIEKIVPLHTYEEKLIVVEKEIPKPVPRYEPVPLVVEKPFILRNEEIREIRVQVPVPIYIEKEVVKVVKCVEEKIVEKIVEVPRVEIVEKVVEKIVTIPRIIEKIVMVPQIIEKCVMIESPVLELVTLPVEKLVIERHEVPVEVNCKEEVLRIEKEVEYVEVLQSVEVVREKEKLIEVDRTVEQIVEVVREIPREIIREKLVDRVVQVREVVPIDRLVQVPIHVPVPVPIEIEKPVFYKQIEEFVHEVKCEVEKVVPFYEIKKEVVYVQQQVPILEEVEVSIPGETIILQEPTLEIVEFFKDKYIPVPEVTEVPVQKYLDMDKIVRINQNEYVHPQKVVEYLSKPQEILISKPVEALHLRDVPVRYSDTHKIGTRVIDEVIKVERCNTEKLQPVERVIQRVNDYEKIVEVAIKSKEQYEVIEVEKEVLRVDERKVAVEVEKEKIVEGLKEIIYRAEEVPQYIEKVVEKIIMLPQIVQVEKKCYMIEEINSLIAKDTTLEAQTREYDLTVESLKSQLDELLSEVRKKRGDKSFEKLGVLLQEFRSIVHKTDKMPKIVERVKQVLVEVEKDRPVLIPSGNSERQSALTLLIHDLIDGICKFRREDINRNFNSEILHIFSKELESGRSPVSRIKHEPTQDIQEPEDLLITDKAASYYKSYASTRANNYQSLISTLQSRYLHDVANDDESSRIVETQRQVIESLQNEIADYKEMNSNVQYQRDKLQQDLVSLVRRVKDSLSKEEFEKVNVDVVQSVADFSSSSFVKKSIVIDRHSVVERVDLTEEHTSEYRSALSDKEMKIAEIYLQLSKYENDNFEAERKINQLMRENELLEEDVRILKSSVPESEGQEVTERINREWESRISNLKESYEREISSLRSDVSTKRKEESHITNDFLKENRALTDELRNLRRQYDILRQAHQRCSYTLENEKKKIIDDYERRLKGSTAPSTIEKELRREIDTLRRNNEIAENKFESQKQRIIDDYERKISSTASNQERELQREIESLKRNKDIAEKKFEAEKQRIINEYERKLSSPASDDRELRREVETLRKNQEQNDQRWELQNRKTVDEYERKIRSIQNSHQQELERVKTSRKETSSVTSPEKIEEVRMLKDQVKKLEAELEVSKKEIEQKSRLGHTTYTSGIKQSGYQGEFQSPNIYSDERERFRYRSPQTESQMSKEEEGQESQVGSSRVDSQVSKSKVVRSGVKVERRYEEMEEVRSSSSRISGGSETSTIFKTSMTMREFMDIKKIDDKDNIATLVMIKVIEKIQEEADKGMINSYNPSNIYLSNFNPNNIDALIVRFGAPITNRNSKTDGLYLSPEVHRGEGTNLKAVVFTLAVIWDELIHYEIYFKTNSEVENLSHEFKVRDTRLNPILKNTLFEMMSKDASKRLDLGEAKRRLSLQRYILTEGRAVASSSRVSTQSKREM